VLINRKLLEEFRELYSNLTLLYYCGTYVLVAKELIYVLTSDPIAFAPKNIA